MPPTIPNFLKPIKVAELMAIGPGVICEIANISKNSLLLRYFRFSITSFYKW